MLSLTIGQSSTVCDVTIQSYVHTMEEKQQRGGVVRAL